MIRIKKAKAAAQAGRRPVVLDQDQLRQVQGGTFSFIRFDDIKGESEDADHKGWSISG